jgi:hypothetical protein
VADLGRDQHPQRDVDPMIPIADLVTPGDPIHEIGLMWRRQSMEGIDSVL